MTKSISIFSEKWEEEVRTDRKGNSILSVAAFLIFKMSQHGSLKLPVNAAEGRGPMGSHGKGKIISKWG